MKRSTLAFTTGAGLLALLALLAVPAQAGRYNDAAPGQAKVVDNQFIVVFDDSEQDPAGKANGLARKHGVAKGREWSTKGSLLKGFTFRWAGLLFSYQN